MSNLNVDVANRIFGANIELPDFSGNVTIAFAVVKAMRQLGYKRFLLQYNNNQWIATFAGKPEGEMQKAFGDSPAVAICKAALMCVED